MDAVSSVLKKTPVSHNIVHQFRYPKKKWPKDAPEPLSVEGSSTVSLCEENSRICSNLAV